MTSHPRTQGFTLVELLVVISIIGILSSVVLTSLSTARSRGNDAARISNVKALETSMEIYFNDYNSYPQYGSSGAVSSVSNLSSFLVPKYIPVIPQNLVSDSDQYVWASNAYGLYVHLDNVTAFTDASGWCKTGVNVNALWWGSGVPLCNF